MIFNENTKLIGRFHTQPSPRGLNIYNPFFEEAGINAAYQLFHNENIEPLLQGMKDLNLLGAITAGFETDSELPGLLDELDETSKITGRVGFILNNHGKFKGYAQGGIGLMLAIREQYDFTYSKIVVVGAGAVATGLILAFKKLGIKEGQICIYNRTIEKANAINEKLGWKMKVYPLTELKDAKGDLLVNATPIGSIIKDKFYTSELVSRFKAVADVTFATEDTNLRNLALQKGKVAVSGWDMFTYQGAFILRTLLGREIDTKLLNKHVRKGLSSEVK